MLLNCGTGEYLESPLNCKEIQPIHPKGNQSWIFIGRTDVEAETPVLWPSCVKSWLIGKDPDAGKDWGQEEKGMTEDEMAGWHHWLDGYEFEQGLGVTDGQGGLVCCSHKELDMTERLTWTERNCWLIWKDRLGWIPNWGRILMHQLPPISRWLRIVPRGHLFPNISLLTLCSADRLWPGKTLRPSLACNWKVPANR